jgi:2-polyprenyl-3-methyl-5-hydroxy-6-metoxy-1,4-benzoquinol methylase
MFKKVNEYFEDIAADFDSYYERPKGLVNKVVNAWLRKPGLIKRMKIALKLMDPCSGKRILDVGCGSGKLAIECAKRGAEVYGTDVSTNMIEIAKKHCEKNNVKVELVVGDALKGLPKNFDISIALGVVEYLDCPDVLLGNMLGSVKNGGKVIFSVPSFFAFQTLIRKVYLYFRKVKCYFYTRRKLLRLVSSFKEVGGIEIYSYGPGFVVQLTKSEHV